MHVSCVGDCKMACSISCHTMHGVLCSGSACLSFLKLCSRCPACHITMLELSWAIECKEQGLSNRHIPGRGFDVMQVPPARSGGGITSSCLQLACMQRSVGGKQRKLMCGCAPVQAERDEFDMHAKGAVVLDRLQHLTLAEQAKPLAAVDHQEVAPGVLADHLPKVQRQSTSAGQSRPLPMEHFNLSLHSLHRLQPGLTTSARLHCRVVHLKLLYRCSCTKAS